jgi:hypothetical protein
LSRPRAFARRAGLQEANSLSSDFHKIDGDTTSLTGKFLPVLFASILVAAAWIGSSFYRSGFVDSGDPYSDYLVRNTVKNNLFGHENQNSFLIETKKHRSLDFHYDPEGTTKRYHAVSVHARLISAIATFLGASTPIGFCIAVAIHIHLVAVDLGIPLKDAPAIALGNAAMRTMSLEEGVPAPLSFEFLRLMAKSLREPVLSIPHFPILVSKMSVVLALVVILVVHIKDRRYARAAIIAWAFVAYLSWFIFAYQHLMVHAMDGLFYDNLLFALTCEICLFSEALRFIST